MKNLYTAFFFTVIALSSFTLTQARNFSGITGNNIGSNQTICFNKVYSALTGSVPGGGTGVYTYPWQTSSTSAVEGFANIGAATCLSYAPAALLSTKWYRRVVFSGIELEATAATYAPVKLTANTWFRRIVELTLKNSTST